MGKEKTAGCMYSSPTIGQKRVHVQHHPSTEAQESIVHIPESLVVGEAGEVPAAALDLQKDHLEKKRQNRPVVSEMAYIVLDNFLSQKNHKRAFIIHTTTWIVYHKFLSNLIS
jgi:hypothetical protein